MPRAQRLSFVLTLVAVSGCTLFPTNAAPSSGNSGSDLFPGGKDSFWAYDKTVSKDNTDTKTYAVVYLENSASSGGIAFKVYGPANPGVDGDNNLLVKITSSQVLFGPGADDQRLPLPFADGKTADPYKEVYNNNKDSIQPKIFAPESVSVPAGNFNAWRIDYTDTTANGGPVIRKWWLASGVGTVKVQLNDPASTTKYELNSYSLR